MKKILKFIVASMLGLVILYPILWILTSTDIFGEIEFGYYGDFYKATRHIRDSGCADQIEYSRHEDVSLESFHFKVHTKSGQVVLIWFENKMNINEVCNNPKGVLVAYRGGDSFQCYTIEELSSLLSERGLGIRNINDILCKMYELAPIFETNYKDQSIRTLHYKDKDFYRYLQITIISEGDKDSFIYSK